MHGGEVLLRGVAIRKPVPENIPEQVLVSVSGATLVAGNLEDLDSGLRRGSGGRA